MLKREPKFKIIVAGEGGVGKTTFVTRSTVGEYIEEDDITIGANFAVKKVPINGREFSFQIWDFAGEERFRFILPAFCRGTAAGLVCFDLTRPPTLAALPSWINMIRKYAGDIPLVLVGFKADMLQGETPLMMPCVDLDHASQFAREHNLVDFIPISAKEDSNIHQAFVVLSNFLQKRKVERIEV
jgi:small GTP-binding protein